VLSTEKISKTSAFKAVYRVPLDLISIGVTRVFAQNLATFSLDRHNSWTWPHHQQNRCEGKVISWIDLFLSQML
jgi:hypothetical protein